MKKLRRIGNFYTRIIMNNVGIFIFVGLLSVLFHERGWFPNENMYALSQFVYRWILPTLMAFEGGRLICGKEGSVSGGILAVLAVGGMLMKDTDAGIFAAMIAGPAAGSLWKLVDKKIRQSVNPGIQMLVRNLCLGILGALLAALGMWAIVPGAECTGRRVVPRRGFSGAAENDLAVELSDRTGEGLFLK